MEAQGKWRCPRWVEPETTSFRISYLRGILWVSSNVVIIVSPQKDTRDVMIIVTTIQNKKSYTMSASSLRDKASQVDLIHFIPEKLS